MIRTESAYAHISGDAFLEATNAQTEISTWPCPALEHHLAQQVLG